MQKYYGASKVGGNPDHTWKLKDELNKEFEWFQNNPQFVIERIDLIEVKGWSCDDQKYKKCPQYIIIYSCIKEDPKPFNPDPDYALFE